MPSFYPINTPLINYFFYKAPFIADHYTLTSGAIVNGGSNYFVDDIIILNQGTYNSPVTLKVTSTNPPLMLGAVTGVTITSGGDYLVTPGAGFDQLASSGIGTGFTFGDPIFAPSNQIPPGPNIPLAGGFLFFYEDENRTVQANTYSDVTDPANPVVNENPIQLGASGEIPLFYLDDRFYYIVITDSTADQSNPVQTIEHYNPSEILSNTSAFNDNFIVNPQFNYPVTFYKTTDTIGEINDPKTVVAWSWEFLEDVDTTTENFVTFNNVAGQEIEGNPIFEIVLDSDTVSGDEATKEFRSYLGSVDFYEDDTLTFSAQMISKRGVPVTVNILLERFYGNGGSAPELIQLTTLSIGITRKKYTFSFSVPTIIGKIIGDGDYLAIRIQVGLQAVCIFGMTNVMVLPGSQLSPVFVDEPYGFSKGQILGESTDIDNAGLFENYSSYYYSQGRINPYADTGAIVLVPNNVTQKFREKCDGTEREINKYSPNNIPYQRLYNAIGTLFGASGGLLVSSNGDVVTFSSPDPAREKSVYTAGTTAFTVVNTQLGLQMGVKLIDNKNNTVTATFFNEFAPEQNISSYGGGHFITGPVAVANYWGASYNDVIPPTNILISTVNPGGPSTQSVFTIDFTLDTAFTYQTRFVGNYEIVASWMEFSSFSSNARRPAGQNSNNQQILFQLDNEPVPTPGLGASVPGGPYSISTIKTVIVPFFSSKSMLDNIKTFVETISTKFIWTLTVTVFPTAGTYFLYSSETVDFYGWFTVDGAGTDPMVSGRTGIEIPIFTGQSTTRVAEIIAETINDATFNVPSPADLPALVADSKVSWFINL
jgi:hypothetical protein